MSFIDTVGFQGSIYGKFRMFVDFYSDAYYDWSISWDKKCDNRRCNERVITLEFFITIK